MSAEDVRQLQRNPYLVALLRAPGAAVEAALAALVQAGSLKVQQGQLTVAAPRVERTQA